MKIQYNFNQKIRKKSPCSQWNEIVNHHVKWSKPDLKINTCFLLYSEFRFLKVTNIEEKLYRKRKGRGGEKYYQVYYIHV